MGGFATQPKWATVPYKRPGTIRLLGGSRPRLSHRESHASAGTPSPESCAIVAGTPTTFTAAATDGTICNSIAASKTTRSTMRSNAIARTKSSTLPMPPPGYGICIRDLAGFASVTLLWFNPWDCKPRHCFLQLACLYLCRKKKQQHAATQGKTGPLARVDVRIPGCKPLVWTPSIGMIQR